MTTSHRMEAKQVDLMGQTDAVNVSTFSSSKLNSIHTMIQYQIPCDCGAKTTVSRSQAGMRIACASCGKPIEVPTIRNLANFAVPTETVRNAPKKPSGSGIAIGLGLIASAALITGVSTLIYGGMMSWDYYQLHSDMKRQDIDLTRSEEDFFKEMRTIREGATPADTWDYWRALTEDGLSEPNPPEYFQIKRYLDSQAPWIRGYFYTAAVSLTVFAASAFLMQQFRRRDT